MSTHSKVIAQTDTQMDIQTDTDGHTHRHTNDDENITSTAYAGGDNTFINYAIQVQLCFFLIFR